MIKVIIRIDTDQTVEIGEYHLGVELSMGRIIEEGHNMLIIIEMTLGEAILEECKIIEVKISEVDREVTIKMITLEKEEDLGERKYWSNFRRNDQSSSKSRSDSRASTNRERIRCFKCREYDLLLKTVQMQ